MKIVIHVTKMGADGPTRLDIEHRVDAVRGPGPVRSGRHEDIAAERMTVVMELTRSSWPLAIMDSPTRRVVLM